MNAFHFEERNAVVLNWPLQIQRRFALPAKAEERWVGWNKEEDDHLFGTKSRRLRWVVKQSTHSG
jgi:hypothetical protein